MENSTLKRRRHKGSTVRGGDMADRISNLPESLISHILSLLPTKSAAATSFLSKSWRLRWTKVTALDFDDKPWPDCESEEEMNFPEFVNLVFANHTESIHKLRLRWRSCNVRPVYLNIWLNAAIARNIQDLDLAAVPLDGDATPKHGDEEYEFRLPAALYTSASLRVLKLQGPFRVKLPHLVCLPKLAILELIYVKFECDESVAKLVSACPVLHSLKIKRYHYHGDLLLCRISSQFLKSFEIHFEEGCRCAPPLGLKLVIDTPALKHLVICSRVHMEIICIQDVLVVNELELDISHIDGGKDGAVKLVQGCCDGVESMTIWNNAMVALGLGTVDVKMSATFGRLTKLVAEFPRSQWSCLLDLLNRCVNLQILDIRAWDMFTREEEEDVNPKSVPQCFSSSLKHVYFRSFDGWEDEMDMLEFILDHGLLIDTVTLFSNDYFPIDDTAKLHILNEVSKLPRVSATCKISLS